MNARMRELRRPSDDEVVTTSEHDGAPARSGTTSTPAQPPSGSALAVEAGRGTRS